MPLTAMTDMPDGFQGLKRQNLLGYEHVLESHVWTGEDDPMMGMGDVAPPSGGIDIPQASGIPIHVPDFNTIKSPSDFLNAGVSIFQATQANKLAKKQIQAQAQGKAGPRSGPGSGGGGVMDEIMPYAPYLLAGGVVLALALYASKGRKE